MTILVFGGTGFIGRRVIPTLVERGENVVCMDNNPDAGAFADLEGRYEFIRGDITQFQDVVGAIIESKADRVLNLAYLLGGGEANPHINLRLNVLGMDNCFEAARLCEVKRVVYASSIAVSGLQSHFGERVVTEDDPSYGTSQYAVHKIFNEFQAKQYIQNYGMSITGIRPANVTGPDKVRGSTDHVQCITQPARGEPVQFPFKSLMRLPIHVDDIAEAFIRVTLADFTHHSIYSSGGAPISIGELAEVVKEYIPDARISFDSEGGVEESGTYLVDNTRLREEFELEFPPFRTRVLQIINDVREESGLPPVS